MAAEHSIGGMSPATAAGATGEVEIAQLYCVHQDLVGTAEFGIYLFRDMDAEPVLVTAGDDGLIVINGIISATTNLTPHKIVELNTGKSFSALFEVEAGAVTKIIVMNYVGEGMVPTATATSSGTMTLTNTGASARQRGMELGPLALLAIAGLDAAGVSVRRRAA